MEPETITENKPRFHPAMPLVMLSAVFALSASGWFIWRDLNKENSEVALTDPSGTQTEEKPASTTTENGAPKEVPKEDLLKAKMPSLTRAIPADASPAAIQKINEAIGLIQGNYDYLQAWLQLGLLRNSVGDYEGAIEAWKFATLIRPQNSMAFLNLGDLYGWYLKDNIKAEQYLLAGIAAEPNIVYPYYKTYEFYADILKDAVKAKKVLQDGIASNPDSSQDLQKLLS